MTQISPSVEQAVDLSVTADLPAHLPDHTELPESKVEFVKNYLEPPLGDLLTHTIWPVLEQIHPDGQFAIGRDGGIYWRLTNPPEPPEKGAEAPDWFYIPNVPPLLDGTYRRSYVLWKEFVAPLIVLEFVSGDGSDERDKTPVKGKFWVYEKAIRVPFYGIYDVSKAELEVYQLINGRYQLMTPNERGHYLIEPMGVELGIWQGVYQAQEWPWLRWWDAKGNLLLLAEERLEFERQEKEEAQQRAEIERQRAEIERQRAEIERQRAERLAEQLRALGIDPDA